MLGISEAGSILVWETTKSVPVQNAAISQETTHFSGNKLLLDGQQRLTSLAAVINGEPVKVRGRKKPIDILFNLEHSEGPPTEILEVEDDELLYEINNYRKFLEYRRKALCDVVNNHFQKVLGGVGI